MSIARGGLLHFGLRNNNVALCLLLCLSSFVCLGIGDELTVIENGLGDSCSCTDDEPPGGLSCAKQKEYGKCTADWMVNPKDNGEGAPNGYCQITCGRCPCEDADLQLGIECIGNGPCICSDFPPPGTEFSCLEQNLLGKCDAIWMREVSEYPEGYCQMTCGRCPCRFPDIRPASPVPESYPSPCEDLPPPAPEPEEEPDPPPLVPIPAPEEEEDEINLDLYELESIEEDLGPAPEPELEPQCPKMALDFEDFLEELACDPAEPVDPVDPPPPLPAPAPEEEEDDFYWDLDLYEFWVFDVPVPEPDIEPVIIEPPEPEPEPEFPGFPPLPELPRNPSFPLEVPIAQFAEFPPEYEFEDEFAIEIVPDIATEGLILDEDDLDEGMGEGMQQDDQKDQGRSRPGHYALESSTFKISVDAIVDESLINGRKNSSALESKVVGKTRRKMLSNADFGGGMGFGMEDVETGRKLMSNLGAAGESSLDHGDQDDYVRGSSGGLMARKLLQNGGNSQSDLLGMFEPPPAPKPEVLRNFEDCMSIRQIIQSDLMKEAGGFSIVGQLIKKSGLIEDLSQPKMKSTLFVATDSAFHRTKFPDGITLESLLYDTSIRNNNFIRKLMLFSIVPTQVHSSEFTNGLTLKTLYSSPLAGLDNSTEDEISRLTLNKSGDGWKVSGGEWVANIIVNNIGFCNSLVHLLDSVLWPPNDGTFLPFDPSIEPCNSITGRLESVVGTLHFSILRKLLAKAAFDLELSNPTLKATVFAPTDEAFLNMPEPYSIDRMLNDTSPETITQLQKFMLFHAVPKKILFEELEDGMELPTYLYFLEGGEDLAVKSETNLRVEKSGNSTYIVGGDSKAKIVIQDMDVCENVMHWIDTALIPTGDEHIQAVLTKRKGASKSPHSNSTGHAAPPPKPKRVLKKTNSSGSEPSTFAPSELGVG